MSEEPRLWDIAITPTAQNQLRAVKDKRIQRKIVETIDDLRVEPEKKGKPLVDDLLGFRSIRSVGQRYRVLYVLQEQKVVVVVVAVGIRREGGKDDVYALTKKLLKRGLLEIEQEGEP